MNSSELRAQRSKLVTAARELVEKAEAENRQLTQEESTSWQKLMDDVDSLKQDIDRAERKERLESLEQEQRSVQPRKTAATPTATNPADREQALRAWLLAGGRSKITKEQIRSAEDLGINLSDTRLSWNFSKRALSHTGSAGGYTVPTGAPALAEHLKYFCPIRNYAQVLTTDSGIDLPYATNDDTSNQGERISENSAHNEQDTAFGLVTLRSYIYSSKLVRIPRALIEDSSINIEDYVARKLAERIGRIQEYEFVFSGTGSGQPKSLVASAGTGKSSFDATDWTHWVDLEHSVDLIYRRNASWVMHDLTVAAIKKLEGDAGQPLWLDGNLRDGTPPRFLGYPVVVTNSMDYTGSTKKVALFGDLSQFIIRDVGGVEIVRSNERYMEYSQVAVVGFQRSDSNFVGPASALKAGVTS